MHPQLIERYDVVDTAYPTAGNEIDVGKFLQHLFIESRRRALQHSVLGNVGCYDFFDSFLAIVRDERKEVTLRRLQPASDGNFLIFHISAKNDAVGAVAGQPTLEHRRLFHGNTAAGYHLRTAIKCDFQVFVTFEATAKINRQRRVRSQGFEGPVIDDMLSLGTVEIDHMQTFQPIVFKHFRHFERILIIDFLAGIVALRQSYAFTVDNIYGGNEFYHLLKR